MEIYTIPNLELKPIQEVSLSNLQTVLDVYALMGNTADRKRAQVLQETMILNNITLSTIRSGKGDCFHLRFNGHNVIIDSGPTSSAGAFRNLCNAILATGERLDALIITHYDDDHLGGILRVGDPGFHDIYLNAYDGVAENENLSAAQNQRLFHMLPSTIVHPNILSGELIEIGGMKL